MTSIFNGTSWEDAKGFVYDGATWVSLSGSQSGGGTSDASIVWSDDFDDAAGSGLPSPWAFDLSGENNEAQANTSGTAVCYQDGNSNLVLVATNTPTTQNGKTYSYSSAQPFGTYPSRTVEQGQYLEFRYNWPQTVMGAHPALWLMGCNDTSSSPPANDWPYCGEIDLWEVMPADSTSEFWVSLHAPASGDPTTPEAGQAATNQHLATPSLDNAWHTIGVWFNSGSLVLYMDGEPIATATESQAPPGSQWPFSEFAFFPLLSIYVGDADSGTPVSPWPTGGVQLLVDYVKVWSTCPY